MGLEFGLASSLFAVALCFTLITMYDAAGVRYHSGKHVSRFFLRSLMQGTMTWQSLPWMMKRWSLAHPRQGLSQPCRAARPTLPPRASIHRRMGCPAELRLSLMCREASRGSEHPLEGCRGRSSSQRAAFKGSAWAYATPGKCSLGLANFCTAIRRMDIAIAAPNLAQIGIKLV